MLKLVTRGIRANLGRLILTLISVFLGVSAVSGSFVLADSLRSVFDGIFVEALAKVDAQVRPEPSEIADAFSGSAEPTFDQSIQDQLQALPEVDRAEGTLAVFERVYTLNEEGEVMRPTGPPVFANSWTGVDGLSAFKLEEGTAPSGQQVAVDVNQANAAGFEVGDTIDVALATGEIEQFELSGIISFEAGGGPVGPYFITMDLDTIQRVTQQEGLLNTVELAAADGTSTEDMMAAVSGIIPDGTEVVAQDVLIEEGQAEFGQIIDVIGGILLGFAFVILFVSVFIIYNTFVILVGQRTKMLGLLRSIGASGNQIRLMVLIESVIIGLLASIAGLVGGLGIAWLLKWVFSQVGSAIPDGPLELLPRTIIVVFAVGMLVTVGSALIPAFRAASVSPLEAVRDGGVKDRSLTSRVIAGTVVLLAGLGFLAFGLTGRIDSTQNTFIALGVGGALAFIGVSMLSALFAGAVASIIGKPVEQLKGITGRLARDNASRNPQRTSATATALMIGLALITGVAVLTASLIQSFDDLLEDVINADLLVFEANQGIPFSPVLVEPLAELDEVDTLSAFSALRAAIDDDDIVSARAWNSETGTSIIDMGLVDGDLNLGSDGVAVFDEEADERGLALGDFMTFEFEDGELAEFEVKALFDRPGAVDEVSWLFDRQVAADHLNSDSVLWIGMTLTGGLDPESDEFAAARAKVEAVVASQPQLSTQDNAEFREQAVGQINQLQALIFGLLIMCVVVAFFGIVNTMVLSVLERTREIGLLRAVGTTRSQLRTSIRWEAVIVSLFGSLLGVIMGVALGWAVVTSIPADFLSSVAIPWVQIVISLVAGAAIGVVAAFAPGYRAAQLDVLDAIAHE